MTGQENDEVERDAWRSPDDTPYGDWYYHIGNPESKDAEALFSSSTIQEKAVRQYVIADKWMDKFGSGDEDYWYWKGIRQAAETQFREYGDFSSEDEALDVLLNRAKEVKKEMEREKEDYYEKLDEVFSTDDQR